jgi:hypothetical protein
MTHDVSKDRVALIPTTQCHISEDFRITERTITNLAVYFKIVFLYTDANLLVLHSAKEDSNIIHTANRRKNNWIGHILRGNCLLKHGIGGKIREDK